MRRRDQLAAAAPALRRRQRRRAGRSASASCTTCPASARTCRTTSRSTSSTRRKQPVSIAPALKWRNRPWSGCSGCSRRARARRTTSRRRLHPLERGRRLPERDVPLPADRRPLRRHGAGGARLPGARRSDVLRRARLGEDHVDRPDASSRAALQLPVDRAGPAGVGRGVRVRARDPRPARVRAFNGGELSPGRRSRPTRRSSTGCASDAETALHPSCTARWA